MRRTKASLIYRRTKNLWVVQLLLGHTKLESTVRYLGIYYNYIGLNGRVQRGSLMVQLWDLRTQQKLREFEELPL
jgi:integrase